MLVRYAVSLLKSSYYDHHLIKTFREAVARVGDMEISKYLRKGNRINTAFEVVHEVLIADWPSLNECQKWSACKHFFYGQCVMARVDL